MLDFLFRCPAMIPDNVFDHICYMQPDPEIRQELFIY